MVKKFTFNDRDTDILRALLTIPWITPKQMCSLYWADTSLKYVRNRLAWLASKKEGYLKSREIPRTLYPFFYTITEKGVAKAEGEIPLFFGQPLPNFTVLPHYLLTVEVLIAALKLPRVLPNTTLYYSLHDFTLRHMLQVAIPDDYIDIRITHEQIPIWLEVHTGVKPGDSISSDRRKFKIKIEEILTSVAGGGEYRKVFGTPYVTVAIVTPYAYKIPYLKAWTEEVLAKLQKKHEADLFRFGAIPWNNIDPVELFTKPIFERPFDTRGWTLLG